jgi:hypothetical protein
VAAVSETDPEQPVNIRARVATAPRAARRRGEKFTKVSLT